MSYFGILHLQDDLRRSNGNSCSICFRSASERRLVEPVFLSIYLSNIPNSRNKFKKQIKSCYMCEALASSAVRFQAAVDLAMNVSELCDDITKTHLWDSVFACLNNREMPIKSIRGITGSILQRAVSMDKTLCATRRYELCATDTLLISSVKNKPSPVLTQKPPPPVGPCPPLSDTVVILDDDEPSVPSHLRVVNPVNNETVLHPVLKGADGKLYVPSLQVQILDNGTLQGVPAGNMQTTPPQPMTQTIPFQNTVSDTQNQTFVHTSRPKTYDKVKQLNKVPVITITHTDTSCVQTVTNSQTLTNTQTLTHTPKTCIRAKSKANEKTDYLNFVLSQNDQRRSESNVDIQKLNVSVVTDNKRRRLPNPLITQNENFQVSEMKCQTIDDDDNTGSVVSRAAVPRTDQTVDWEDKIPMDVISFVDATDPNPSERIMQPARALAVIADVRSVPARATDAVEPDVTVVPQHIECIDLC